MSGLMVSRFSLCYQLYIMVYKLFWADFGNLLFWISILARIGFCYSSTKGMQLLSVDRDLFLDNIATVYPLAKQINLRFDS